jgi:hypothetical protein
MTGLTFWLPTVVQSFGLAGREKSTLLTIPPAVLYIITSVTFGYFFDRTTRFPKPIYMYIAQICAVGCFIGLTLCRSTTGLFVLIMVSLSVVAKLTAVVIHVLGSLPDLHHPAACHVDHRLYICRLRIRFPELPR